MSDTVRYIVTENFNGAILVKEYTSEDLAARGVDITKAEVLTYPIQIPKHRFFISDPGLRKAVRDKQTQQPFALIDDLKRELSL